MTPKHLKDFEFTAVEYAIDPEDVFLRALAFAGRNLENENIDVLAFLNAQYQQKKMCSATWEPSLSLKDGCRLSCSIGLTVVSGLVRLAPKRISVRMDLPCIMPEVEMTLQMIAPVLFTEHPEDGSEANEYGTDVARRLLLDSYYNSFSKK